MAALGTVLVVGASGVVGRAAVEELATAGGWEVISLSRRQPEDLSRPVRHLSVDLRNAAASRAALTALSGVTHVVYTALYEKPGLIPGWRERDQMETNLEMLRNLMEPLLEASPGLRHVSLLQGTKAYGVHLHALKVPAREDGARDPHENFYWLQQDYLTDLAVRKGFAWTVFRPQIVFGDALGVVMNLIPILGIFAAMCREEGRPFGFPGGPDVVLEAVDARLLARALAWAAATPACANQIFNITNGDVFVWRNVWPVIAECLGMKVGPDAPLKLATFLPERAGLWDAIVAKHALRPIPLSQMLGESHHYADFCFAWGAEALGAPPPAIVSTIKARRFGFHDCIDTHDMFRHWFRVLIDRKILPRP
jgi:nucleoside-diphosphate-sugar epimerase